MRLRRDYREERAEIAGRLAERIDSLVRELLPGGIYGKGRREWRVGSLAGEPGGSLVVCLSGPWRGRWKEFNGEDATKGYGDALDLVVRLEGGGDFLTGLARAKQRLGYTEISDDERKRWRARQRQRQAVAARQQQRDEAARRARAWEIFEKARRVVAGDLVDRYLIGRGIKLAALGRVPSALRFHPSLWAADNCFLPAMVAAVTNGEGEFCAVHRTFLQVTGSRVTKAEIDGDDANKKLLGPSAGGSIKLWRGVSGKGWVDMPLHETVLLSEGIEDLLSALLIAEIGFTSRNGRQRIVPAADLRGVVGLGLSFMRIVELPARVERVVILAQRDPVGSNAQHGLEAVIQRFRLEGREVLLLPPPAWSGVKDLNDLAQRL
jgi:hypothetical protein